MAVTHTTTVRNAIADSIWDTLDSGKLKLRITGSTADTPSTAACALTLNAAAAAAASGGVATAAAITSDTNATGNASAVAFGTLETAGGVVKVHFAVAASGSDFNLSGGLTINAGDTVSCSSLTYTAPA